MKQKLQTALEKLDNRFDILSWKKAFGILTAIYLTAIYPIIRANYNYIDDMGRAFKGYTSWKGFGRYISEYLSRVIHASRNFLFDISPIPQLLAVCILVISSLIVISQVKNRRTISLWELLMMLPLGLSPYFLECLSYKYDSPYMALSILASTFPLLFRKKHMMLYCFSIITGVLTVCMTYQAASGIFPMLIVLLSFLMWCRGESYKMIVVFVAQSAVSYLIGVGVFCIAIMNPVDTYVSNKITAFSEIVPHYIAYLKLVRSDFKMSWILIMAVLTIWFIVVSVYKSERNKVVSFLLSVVVTAVMLLLSFGLYPALERPLTAPRAMYGIGAYIAFIGIGNMAEGAGKWLTRVLTCILAWVFITFSCAYGNALAVQDKYIDFRISEVIEDLTDLKEFNSDGEKSVKIVGSAGHAPALQNAMGNCNMLRRLIPITFIQDWYWGAYKFFNYYGLKNVKENTDALPDFYDGWILLQESSYHRIYGQDNKFIIELK